MPPLENQPVKQPQQGAEFGYEPPPLYVFTGDGKESKTPSLYQFSGNPQGQEIKTGPQVYLGPVGQDWGPRIGPAERRIDQMPEGPEKQRALARETNVLFNVPVALKAYRDDIKAADAIDQADVARRNTDNVTLLKQNEAQIAQARAANAAPEQMNALLKKQDELQTNQKLIVNDYYAPATTRINAGLALITTGQDMLVDYGQNLIDEGLKLRPELSSNSEFRKNLEAARQACIKNREAAFSGEVGNPYQFSGDGTVPGGIPQKKPGVPGQPGLGGDGKPLPNGNPGFTPIPGYDAPPPNATPFPTFKRGGETPPNARKDLPKPPQPVENFAPPQKQEKPKEAQADKSLWDQASDGQKLVAAALAAYLGYKLVQRGNRIALERSRDAGNEALGKTPENAAKLKEAIERAGQEMARDNFVKAEMVKEGEHAGKYEVTGADGKKKYLSEAEFKERFTETGKPGEYKDVYSGKSKAVKLPDLGELNKELGLGDQATRKLWAVSENGEVKLLTDKEFKQTWRQPTEADKASWEKEAESKLTPEERAAKEKAAAEKLEAEKKAAEEKAAAEKLEAEKKAAEEKAAAEKLEAEKKAAEEKAAAERFRPTTGTEILKGVKVGDVAEVEGAKWSAVGKVEDRVIVRKEGAIEPGIMAQKFEPEKFNRVEIAGESGVFFQRKGTDKIYKHSTVNGAEPVVGQPSLLLVSGLEAKTAGSEIVKALRGDGKSAAKPVEKPAAEPPKADLSKVKSPMSNEKLKLFVDRVENGLTQENMIEELQTRSKEFFGQEGSEQFREVVGRTKFAENAELKAGESKTVYKVGDQSFEPKSFEASPAPGRFVTADGKKVELNDCRIEIQLGKGTTPEQAVRESLLNYNRLNEQVAGTGEGAGTAADLKPTREAVEMKLTEALDVARGKIAPGGAIPSEAAAIAVKLGDFEVGGKTLEVSLTVRGINIGGKEFSSTEVVEMTMKETQKKMNEAKTEMERKALADSLEELKKLHQDVREGKPVEIAKLNESLAGNLKHSYEAIKAGERPGETKPGEVGGRIKGGVGRAGAYLMVTAFVASLLVDRKSSGGTSGADYAPTTVR